ncbi:MAG: leucine-rich repeat protein [Kiritimatiellaeota bacterium]|nr:leucine-rich repeat protein [Kiritimatiellota bacterium]
MIRKSDMLAAMTRRFTQVKWAVMAAVTLLGAAGAMAQVTVITTWSQLQAINNNLGGNYELGCDLVSTGTMATDYDNCVGAGATSKWTPIGVDANNAFTGTFDGKGFQIYDFWVSRGDVREVGLFGNVHGTVKNVTLNIHATKGVKNTNPNSGQQPNAGGLVSWLTGPGVLDGATVKGGPVQCDNGGAGGIVGVSAIAGSNLPTMKGNLRNESDVISSGAAGGVLGSVNNTDITIPVGTTMVNTGNISGAGNIGGVIGSMSIKSAITFDGRPNASAVYVSNSGAVAYTQAGSMGYVGGLFGYAFGSGARITIQNYENTVNVPGRRRAGGIVADTAGDVLITACRNFGAVSTDYTTAAPAGGFAGGIVGATSSTDPAVQVVNSFNAGAVSGQQVGGIIGAMFRGSVNGAYNIGAVTGTGPTAQQRVGGLVGSLEHSTTTTAINNCYNLGAVNGENAGGLIGSIFGNSSAANSYNAGRVSGNGAAAVVGSKVGGSGGANVNIYYDSTTTGVGQKTLASVNAQAKTTANLASGTLQTGLSSPAWAIGGNPKTYPYLAWQGSAMPIFTSITPVVDSTAGATYTVSGAASPSQVFMSGTGFSTTFSGSIPAGTANASGNVSIGLMSADNIVGFTLVAPPTAPAHSNWKLNAGKTFMEHYAPNTTTPDGWKLAVTVGANNRVTITNVEGDSNNTLPGGNITVVPLDDPIYEDDWNTPATLIAIADATGNQTTSWFSMRAYLVTPTTVLKFANSLEHIGDLAFMHWDLTTQLVLPQNLKTIGAYAFADWQTYNAPLTLPASLESIAHNAFYRWDSFNQPFSVPNSVTYIGDYAFYCWYAFNQPFVIPSGISMLNGHAFFGWHAYNHPIVIPPNITNVGDRTFCSWNSMSYPIVIPATVINMSGIQHFGYDDNLPYVLFESGYPFNWPGPGGLSPYISMESVSVPPFSSYILRENVASWATGIGTTTALLLGGNRSFGSQPIRVTVLELSYDANGGSFTGASTPTPFNNPYWVAAYNAHGGGSLSPTKFPVFPGVTPPTGKSLTGWNTAANGSGTPVPLDATAQDITFTGDTTLYAQYRQLDPWELYDCWVMTNDFRMAHYVGGSPDGWDLMVSSNSLGQVTLKEGANLGNTAPVVTAGEYFLLPLGDPIYSLEGDSLSLVKIEDVVGLMTPSHDSPFSNLNGSPNPRQNITDMTLPASLTYIGHGAFGAFWSITNVVVVGDSGTVIPSGVTHIGASAFTQWQKFNQPVVVPAGVTDIGVNAFSIWVLFDNTFTLPDGLLTIGKSAFAQWHVFDSAFTLPEGLLSIDDAAFSGWFAFNQDFTIPASVTNIGSDAFRNWNIYDKALIIPANVATMGETVFVGSTKLKYVLFEGEYPTGLVTPYRFMSTPPNAMTAPNFATWVTRENLADWNSHAADPHPNPFVVEQPFIEGGLIQNGAATLDTWPIRVIEQEIYLDEMDGLFLRMYDKHVAYTNYYWDSSATIKTFVTPWPPMGYTFFGWYTDPVAGVEFTLTTVDNTCDRDFTLYARYTGNSYVATLDFAPGTDGSTTANVTYGDPMPGGLTPPTRPGYDFGGYEYGGKKYYNGDMTSANDWDIAGDETLTAIWTAKGDIVVTFDPNGGAVNPTWKNVTYLQDYGIGGVWPTPALADSVFIGWFRGKLVTAATQVTEAGNHTLTAAWFVPKDPLTEDDTEIGVIIPGNPIDGLTNGAPVDITVDLPDGTTTNITGHLVYDGEEEEDDGFGPYIVVIDEGEELPPGGTVTVITVNPDDDDEIVIELPDGGIEILPTDDLTPGTVIYTEVKEQGVGTFTPVDDESFDYETAVVVINLDNGTISTNYPGYLIPDGDGGYTVVLVGPVDPDLIGTDVDMTITVNGVDYPAVVDVVQGPKVVLNDPVLTDEKDIGKIVFDPENEGDLGVTNGAPVVVVIELPGGGGTIEVPGTLVDVDGDLVIRIDENEPDLPEGGVIIGVIVNPEADIPADLPAGGAVDENDREGGDGTIEQRGLSVTLDTNKDGVAGVETSTRDGLVYKGYAYGPLGTPTWAGWDFLGWWYLGTPVDADTLVTASDDHTLYASWIKFYDPIGGEDTEIGVFIPGGQTPGVTNGAPIDVVIVIDNGDGTTTTNNVTGYLDGGSEPDDGLGPYTINLDEPLPPGDYTVIGVITNPGEEDETGFDTDIPVTIDPPPTPSEWYVPEGAYYYTRLTDEVLAVYTPPTPLTGSLHGTMVRVLFDSLDSFPGQGPFTDGVLPSEIFGTPTGGYEDAYLRARPDGKYDVVNPYPIHDGFITGYDPMKECDYLVTFAIAGDANEGSALIRLYHPPEAEFDADREWYSLETSADLGWYFRGDLELNTGGFAEANDLGRDDLIHGIIYTDSGKTTSVPFTGYIHDEYFLPEDDVAKARPLHRIIADELPDLPEGDYEVVIFFDNTLPWPGSPCDQNYDPLAAEHCWFIEGTVHVGERAPFRYEFANVLYAERPYQSPATYFPEDPLYSGNWLTREGTVLFAGWPVMDVFLEDYTAQAGENSATVLINGTIPRQWARGAAYPTRIDLTVTDHGGEHHVGTSLEYIYIALPPGVSANPGLAPDGYGSIGHYTLPGDLNPADTALTYPGDIPAKHPDGKLIVTLYVTDGTEGSSVIPPDPIVGPIHGYIDTNGNIIPTDEFGNVIDFPYFPPGDGYRLVVVAEERGTPRKLGWGPFNRAPGTVDYVDGVNPEDDDIIIGTFDPPVGFDGDPSELDVVVIIDNEPVEGAWIDEEGNIHIPGLPDGIEPGSTIEVEIIIKDGDGNELYSNEEDPEILDVYNPPGVTITDPLEVDDDDTDIPVGTFDPGDDPNVPLDNGTNVTIVIIGDDGEENPVPGSIDDDGNITIDEIPEGLFGEDLDVIVTVTDDNGNPMGDGKGKITIRKGKIRIADAATAEEDDPVVGKYTDHGIDDPDVLTNLTVEVWIGAEGPFPGYIDGNGNIRVRGRIPERLVGEDVPIEIVISDTVEGKDGPAKRVYNRQSGLIDIIAPTQDGTLVITSITLTTDESLNEWVTITVDGCRNWSKAYSLFGDAVLSSQLNPANTDQMGGANWYRPTKVQAKNGDEAVFIFPKPVEERFFYHAREIAR